MDFDTSKRLLGDEIKSPEEETFDLFSRSIPSHDLGFVDSKASSIEITVAGRDMTFKQSPTMLSSNRAAGTTGAVLWRVSPLVAGWLTASENVLFKHGVLQSGSTVIELGCGITGLVAIALSPHVGTYVATDQGYVLKSLRYNLEENTCSPASKSAASKKSRTDRSSNIEVLELDWESSSISSLPPLLGDIEGLHVVLGCDCIYNESLVSPFVQTCAEICRLKLHTDQSVVCIIAQQLRSDLVFEAWLNAFHSLFHVWRVDDKLLTPALRSGSGYVIHIGILRTAMHASRP